MGQFPPFLCRGPFTCTVNASQSISGANHETHRRRCRNRRSRTHRVFIRTCCPSDPAGQHDGPDSEPHGDNRAHRSNGGANDRGDPSARVGADRSADSDSTASSTTEPTTPPTDVPQPPTATPVPTPTAIHTTELNLLKIAVAEIPADLPDYYRDDWKHWTNSDGDCQDARQEVLVAESRASVAYRTDRQCRVSAGEWLAPYTNTVVTDPCKLDVDHMVPLGNAHASGAWRWSPERREQYAN